MNENINEESGNISARHESDNNISPKELVEMIVEIRGNIIFGISRKKADEFIADIPYDILKKSIPLLEEYLDIETKDISLMPPIGGGMMVLGNVKKINNIRIFLDTIRKKLNID